METTKVTSNASLEKQDVHSVLMPYPSMGNHLVLDFNNVTSVDLNDYQLLNQKLREVLSHTQVSIESDCFKKFEPQGVTILYLLSESHFSIHTWPELKCCAIDFYHCGERSLRNLKIAEEKLCDLFGWENCTSTCLFKRGSVSSYLTNDFLDKVEILRNVKFLHREKSDFQEIRVYDTLAMGRILVLDGAVQISTNSLGENDHYTIDMSRLVLEKDKTYEHVIIIGGGDLPIAAHVLEKYPNVKKLTVCEIDGRVVEVTKKYFQIGEVCQREIENGRLEVVIEGGASYMERLLQEGKESTVGAVIIDCTDFALDENSIAAELFTPKFYETIHKLLKAGAGFSQQITKPYYRDAFSERARKGGFESIDVYLSITPEYGGELPLAHCFKNS
jgi:spermidine synthase